MRSLQRSPWVKAAIWTLMTTCAFLSALFACKALLAGPYTLDSNGGWQENGAFQWLCQKWSNSVATSVADQIALESGSISYVERQQLESALQEFETAVDPSATSYRFRLMDASGEELTSNLPDGETLVSCVAQIHYASFTPGEYTAHELDSYGYYAKYYGWMNGAELGSSAQASADQDAELQSGDLYVLEYGVAARPTVPDVFTQLQHFCANSSAHWMTWAGAAAIFALAALCALAAALWCAGWRAGAEGPAGIWADRVYTEVWLLLAGTAIALLAYVIAKCSDPLVSWYYYDSLWPGDRLYTLCLMGLAAAITAIFLTAALLMQTTAVRAKTHTLVRSTLILRALAWALGGIRTALLSLPVTWKAIVLFLAYTAFNFIAFTDVGRYNGGFILLWFLAQGGALALACWWTISFRRLRTGARAMAEGDLENRVDTHKMPPDLREHGEDLNNISMGLSAAVDEKMKSASRRS